MKQGSNFKQLGSDDDSDNFDPLKAGKKKERGPTGKNAKEADPDDKQSNTII